MQKRRAFTLIEVLVVVAIIALLAAILIPSVSEARRVSKKTVCKTNLHQIGTALQTYMKANRDKLPYAMQNPSVVLPPPYDKLLPLPDVLKREFATPGVSKDHVINKVFECPADTVTKPALLPIMQGNGSRYFDTCKTSYEWNPYLNDKRVDYRKITIYDFTPPAEFPPKDLYLQEDFESFHGGPTRQGSINILFANWEIRSK